MERSVQQRSGAVDKRRQILEPRSPSSPARASTPPASPTSPMRRGSPTASSTTTSTPRTRSSTNSSSSAGRCSSPRSRRPKRPRRRPRETGRGRRLHFDSYRHDPELMKVIIVEVTRAANSFGRTHLEEIRRAYEGIAKIVADGQEAASSAPTSPRASPQGLLRRGRAAPHRVDLRRRAARRGPFDEARNLLVTTICDGLEPR